MFIWISVVNIISRERRCLLWLLLCQILSYLRCTMSAASWFWWILIIWKLRAQMMDFVSFPLANQKLPSSSSKEILNIQMVSRNPYCVKIRDPLLSVSEKQSIRKWAWLEPFWLCYLLRYSVKWLLLSLIGMVCTAAGQKEKALHCSLSWSHFKNNLSTCNLAFKVG